MSSTETVVEPKIEPAKPVGRKATPARAEDDGDESTISFNQMEHDELEALAIGALADIQKEIAGIPASQLPEDVAALRSNLTAALHSLQNTPRHVRVPAVIRNAIRDNAKFVSSGQLEQEIESGGHDDHKVKLMVQEIEHAHAKASTKGGSLHFLGRNRAHSYADPIAEAHIRALKSHLNDKTIATDLHQDFSDKAPRVTADGHAILRQNKKGVVGGLGGEQYARNVNAQAQFATQLGLFGMNAKAAQTSADLTEKATHGTVAEREASQGEIYDAVQRRVLGRTFVGQEIDDALDDLTKNGYKEKLGVALYLDTGTVMNKLKENGWANNGWSFFNSQAANSQWSDQIRQRLDFNHDGQLSSAEIKFGLDHTKRDYDTQKAIEAVRHKMDDLKDRGDDFVASQTKLGKQVKGMLGDFQAFKSNFDIDRDGKAELGEIVQKLHARGIKEIKDVNGDHRIDINDVKKMYNDSLKLQKHATEHPAHAPQTPNAAKPVHAVIAKAPH
ncbi:MAG: hypothetical protein ACKVOE_06095 [Rickettsiales bacterium]